MEEYKGIFYNDNSEKIYYEGGAHFKYKDLVRELTFIKKQRESQISSLSNLSTNDIKTQPPLKKCIIIQKMPNIRENSMGRNIHQNNKKKLIFTKNIRNKYDEKMPLINNRNNSLQQKNNIIQIKRVNKEYNYFSPITNYIHKRDNSKEEMVIFKSSSLKSLVPISNKNQMKNNVKQKSYFFNGFNQKFKSRNVKIVKKSNSTVGKSIINSNQIKLF